MGETKRDESVGIIPIHRDESGELRFLLVKHGAGHWAFPKGHKEEGETELAAARRELAEETGVTNIEIDESKTFEEQYEFERDGERYAKTVRYRVGVVSNMDQVQLPDGGEIQDVRWVRYQEARSLLTFPEAQQLLEEARVHVCM